MGEGNGGSGLDVTVTLGGVDGVVDGASVDPNGFIISSDEGLELRLAGRGGRANTTSMLAYDQRARCPPHPMDIWRLTDPPPLGSIICECRQESWIESVKFLVIAWP